MVPGVDYGNARLRAMRSRLLSAADYESLTTADSMDGLIGALSGTAYAVDLDAALPRFSGLRRYDEVVTGHLVRVLGAIPRFYGDRAEGVIGLVMDRWDLRNLRAVVRGQARFEGADEILRLVVPVGRLGAGALRELAAQPSLRYVIDLMVAWRIPSREAARAVRDAWPQYEESGDVVVLESALNHAFADRVDEVLGETQTQAATVLRAEIDEINVLTALRLRAARLSGEITLSAAVDGEHYLAGGRSRPEALASVAATDDRSEAVARLDVGPWLPGWSDALYGWVEEDDLVRLADGLGIASTRFAVGLFAHGDPLGFDIPVAFTRAQEHEARNLRWIGRGVAHGLALPEIERKVVVIR